MTIMINKKFSSTFILLSIACLTSCSNETISKKPNPTVHIENVVVILADDLGYMDVGFINAATFYETPNLDKLAASGTIFTNAYSTSSVCSPSRYGLMTGKYPSRENATNFFANRERAHHLNRDEIFQFPRSLNFMPTSDITIAENLKSNGFNTFFAGKWHLGPTQKYWPEDQGFDINKGGYHAGAPTGGNQFFSPFKNPKLKDKPGVTEHLPDRLARETVDFINNNRDEKFFAFLSFYSVHTPLMAKEETIEKYERKSFLTDFGDQKHIIGEEISPGLKHRSRQVQSNTTYAAMIESMDDAIGLVLDALDANGLSENTAIIFTSDNGGLHTATTPTSNLPLKAGKGWIYEGGIRVPFLAYIPGISEPGSTSKTPIIGIDILPTVLDITNVEPEAGQIIDGKSVLSFLDTEADNMRDGIFWHYPHKSPQRGPPSGAIREGDWKLIENYSDGSLELYNLSQDIGETKNLVDEEPETVDDLKQKLDNWYKEVDAKFPEKL